MKSLKDLKIQLYADGADKAGILDLYAKPYIKGLTTNPSLMKKAGIRDYEAFAKDILQTVTAKPISFEVFTDDFTDMKRQALKITAFAKNVYTKIPITNSRGESSLPLIRELAKQGVKLNITAILTLGRWPVSPRRSIPRFRPSYPSSPAGSPTPGSTRCRSCGPAARSSRATTRRSSSGQHARGPEHLPGRGERLRRHHDPPRHPREGRQAPRHGPDRALARHGQDVHQGRGRLRFQL